MEMDLQPSGRVNVLGHLRTREEKKAGGSGVMVQLWLRNEPKWKPGCGLFLHQQLGSHLLHFRGTPLQFIVCL